MENKGLAISDTDLCDTNLTSINYNLPWDPIKGWKLRIQHCPADGIHENGQPAVRMYYYCEIPLERAASFGEALSVASQICTGDDHVYVVDGPMKNADGPGPVLYMQPGDSITIL